jgi:hypothetical protein
MVQQVVYMSVSELPLGYNRLVYFPTGSYFCLNFCNSACVELGIFISSSFMRTEVPAGASLKTPGHGSFQIDVWLPKLRRTFLPPSLK